MLYSATILFQNLTKFYRWNGVTNSERFHVLTFHSKGRIRPKNTKMSIVILFVVEENIYG